MLGGGLLSGIQGHWVMRKKFYGGQKNKSKQAGIGHEMGEVSLQSKSYQGRGLSWVSEQKNQPEINIKTEGPARKVVSNMQFTTETLNLHWVSDLTPLF